MFYRFLSSRWPIISPGLSQKLWLQDKLKNVFTDSETARNNENLAHQHATDERLIEGVILRKGLGDLLEIEIIDWISQSIFFNQDQDAQVMKHLIARLSAKQMLNV